MQSEPPQGLHGQKIDEQRAVEQVDGNHPAQDVGGARSPVGLQRCVGADIVSGRARGSDAFRQVGGVAQAEVQALGSDGGNDVRGLPYERRSRSCHVFGLQAHQREHCPGAQLAQVAEQAVQPR